MLSLFPELLDWGFFVPFFFRLFLGLYLLRIGIRISKDRSSENDATNQIATLCLGLLLSLLGLFLVGGIATQPLGAVGFALSVIAFYLKSKKNPLMDESRAFYLLFGLVSLSLILLGPGPYSADLPL